MCLFRGVCDLMKVPSGPALHHLMSCGLLAHLFTFSAFEMYSFCVWYSPFGTTGFLCEVHFYVSSSHRSHTHLLYSEQQGICTSISRWQNDLTGVWVTLRMYLFGFHLCVLVCVGVWACTRMCDITGNEKDLHYPLLPVATATLPVTGVSNRSSIYKWTCSIVCTCL